MFTSSFQLRYDLTHNWGKTYRWLLADGRHSNMTTASRRENSTCQNASSNHRVCHLTHRHTHRDTDTQKQTYRHTDTARARMLRLTTGSATRHTDTHTHIDIHTDTDIQTHTDIGIQRQVIGLWGSRKLHLTILLNLAPSHNLATPLSYVNFTSQPHKYYTVCQKTSPTFLAITRESIDGFL